MGLDNQDCRAQTLLTLEALYQDGLLVVPIL